VVVLCTGDFILNEKIKAEPIKGQLCQCFEAEDENDIDLLISNGKTCEFYSSIKFDQTIRFYLRRTLPLFFDIEASKKSGVLVVME